MKLEYVLIFMLGFFSCMFLFYGFGYSDVGSFIYSNFAGSWGEIPFETGMASLNRDAPSDWISKNDIIIFDDMVILRVSNATLSSYADSGSMKPVFDKGANGIRIVPKNEDEINVGDIISYRFENILIVHRVVMRGTDEDGVYFIAQGDNNILSDGKIRFKNIEYITIGVIW